MVFYIFYAAAFFIFSYGVPGYFVMSPQTSYDLGFSDKPPPACREATPEELRVRGEKALGKAETWNTSGEFICPKDIFDYNERDTFYNFVSKNAAPVAKNAVMQIVQERNKEGQKIKDFEKPWTIEVKADDPDVAAYLHSLYMVELAKELGPGGVIRASKREDYTPKLIVSVRRLQATDILFDLKAAIRKTENSDEVYLWRL